MPRRLAQLLLPYRWSVVLALVLSLFSSFGLLLLPAAAGKLFHIAVSSPSIPLSLIAPAVLGLVCITAGSYWAFTLMFGVAHKVTANLRIQYVNTLLHLPLQSHREHKTGEVLHRLTASIGDIEFFIKYTVALILGVGVLGCGATVMLALLSWELTLVLLFTIALGVLVVRPLLARHRIALQDSEQAFGRVTAYLYTVLLGIDMVKAYNAEPYHISLLKSKHDDLLLSLRTSTRSITLLEPVIISVAIGGVLVVLVVGSRLVASGEMAIDTLIAFLLYAFLLLPQSRTLGLLLSRWQHCRAALVLLDEILGLPQEADPLHAITFPQPIRGEIVLKHVTYRYPDREEALRDVSLRIAPKECLGIVGASGAGKSTLVHLLLRLYDVQTGTVLIDGIDTQRLTAASVRAAIAIVPQDTVLFDDTIFENVRYGRREAAVEEVYAACASAQADHFIRSLPDGYNTTIGERGVKLSGGQRQRIAIARALLKNAPILILDEATSSLDGETERDLHDALATLVEGRTTIVIAHRLSTRAG
ncbi:MAG: ABC transporter ATP-binding protein [Bacteroidota bacterium]